ncbi:MAG TPA: murein biosynthesis integral membrane protein MurJ [Pirellulales bacterium]|jgi:putative peptidoglycan lipid II flippase|nr:murein biosynthesis integral membrane protein MurJ [Pirellulales bacterium]
MASVERSQLFAGLRVTSFGTLASRLLGMVRDMATASLLGLSGDGVMDAFVVAFRIPNLFRRLFGEGALAASYLPVLSAKLEQNRQAAWQLASVTLVWLAVVLAGAVVVAEGACAAAWWFYGDAPGMKLLLGLSAVMLPYLFFICLAAQVSGTLHALAHFSTPALAPTLLNICWLAAIWLVAPRLTDNKELQAYVLACSVLVAGVLQLAAQIAALGRLGFRFDYNWQASRDGVRQIVGSMGPMVLGLAVTQINTFFDSLLAWGLSAPADGAGRIAWLGGIAYPLEQGAAAAIYYGERLYQFPLGLLGVAVATVIFPALSRHAARGEHDRLGEDLTLGLRLVLFLGVPAGAGLMLISEPLARLLFERGEFTAEDTARVARMIRCYGIGVWAYCAAPVVVRGYYALGDRSTPLKAGIVAMALNVGLNLALVWPLAEAGLALSTSLAAMVQVAILLLFFSRHVGYLGWSDVGRTAGRTLAATACMLLAGYASMAWLPRDLGLRVKLARVVAPLAASGGTFFLVSRLLKAEELSFFFGRRRAAE